ncbi:hypothetical protein FRC19_006172 [Serendipita sp. 401]|nr:hypothetical protein FRC19_006172 [Serendipita sp. 401]
MESTAQQMTIEEANVVHFDKAAKEGYDDNPFVEQVSKQFADLIREKCTLGKENTSMMDYACGTGQMSRKLEPYVQKVIGVDISQGMIDYYNKRASDLGIPPEKMQAVYVSSLKGDDSDLDGQKFDIIVCSQAYHHFPDINKVTKDLTNLLKPGTGRLFIADLMQYDRATDSQSGDNAPQHLHHHHHHHHHHQQHHQHQHHQHHQHHHHEPPTESQSPPPSDAHREPFSGPSVAHQGGFTSDQITRVFDSAGLQDIEFIPNAASAEIANRHVQLFVAMGRRP